MSLANQHTYLKLEQKLGYKFTKPSLLEEALSHPSLKQHNPKTKHYEKLEILGDSILGFIITEMIFLQCPELDEGSIAKMKAHIVSKDVLYEIANKLELGKYIIMTQGEEKSGGRDNINNLENTIEALLGAIYLDSNIDDVKKIIHNLWLPHLKETDLLNIDPKSNLQEIAYKKMQLTPTYNTINRTGCAHAPIFTVEASVGSYTARATGNSIKTAEKDAAKLLIKQIK